MNITKLYRYKRADGYTRISPNKPDAPRKVIYRITADEGKLLTDGNITTTSIEVRNLKGWTEIDEPKE